MSDLNQGGTRSFRFGGGITRSFGRVDDIPDEIDFMALAKAIGRRWLLISLIAAVAVLVTAYRVQRQPALYQASMVVAPAAPPNRPASASLLQGSGLGALLSSGAGLDVSNFAIFKQLLTSSELAARLERKHQLLRIIFADRWDPIREEWRTPVGFTAGLKAAAKNLLGMPPTRAPTIQDLAVAISGMITVPDIGRTGLSQVTLRYPDPQYVARLLAIITSEADAAIREREQERASVYIAFLQKQLALVTLAEHRQVLTDLLAMEERNRMLSTVGLPFSFKIVEEVRASADPVEPRPVRAVTLAGVWGLLSGMMLVVARLMLIWAYGRRREA